MPDINYGLLNTAPQAPSVQQFSINPASSGVNTLLGGVQQGQALAAGALDVAQKRQQMQQAAQMNPELLAQAKQNTASGAIDLTQKQRAEKDTLAQRAAAAKGWDSYINTLMQTDPTKALAAIDNKTTMEKNLIGKDKDIEDLSFSKAEHTKSTMVSAGNMMHDIITNGTDAKTGKQDDAKIVAAYQAQYPQIAGIDPKNAPNPKTATPAQIEAYGASTMHLGLDYSLAMKTKYAELQSAAQEAEKTKGAITTDAIKNSQVAAASAIPVKQAAQQYADLLNEIKPNQVGPGFNISLKGRQILTALGGDPNLSVPEALKLASNKLLVSNLKTLKTMPRSEGVINVINGANATPNLSLDVQKQALNTALQESNENIVHPDFLQDFKNKNNQDLAGANSSWQKFLEADPLYQKTGQHDPTWVQNPDNYKPFLDRDYKAPKVEKEPVIAKQPAGQPTLAEIEAEIKKRGLK